MERMTRQTPAGAYLVNPDDIKTREDGVSGRAGERLAAFERMQETVRAEQADVSRRLEEMKTAGKTKTVQFRELMVKKLNNAFVLDLFDWYGL